VNAVLLRDVFRIHRTAEGDAAALQGMTLDVEEGEVVVVLGPSGSGKSTLLRILAALERPSAGVARVLGEDVAHLHGRRAAEFRARSLGLVDQHYERALPPDLPCGEIVGLQQALRGVNPTTRRARAMELLEAVGLGDAVDARPGELSGGQQQRVALCAALAHRPKLLLADEPSGELDAANAAEVYRLIRELAHDVGGTAVIVSHDPGSEAIADRVVRVRDGRLSQETVGEGEALVVGRGGWVHVPADLLDGATHLRAHRDEDGVILETAARRELPPDEQPPVRPPVPGAVVAELASVHKAFGARTVFDGFSSEFHRGLLTTIAGRSGSGKSTLLHMLGGLERPGGGEVLVCGQSLGRLDREGLAEVRRRHIAVVGQDPGLVAFMSAAENVALAGSLRGVADPAAEAERLLADVGLAERATQRVSRLSAGERQRTAIARALVGGPDVMLVDEPTSRLDRANAAPVARLLARAAHERGIAVICATHDPLLLEHSDVRISLG
jgi:ABC-type lipoprotein export system ATPase subunit